MKHFTSAPILSHPDPSRQFIVKDNKDDKVHPCAYFSGKLSRAERNADIGIRVKALQESTGVDSLAGVDRATISCLD